MNTATYKIECSTCGKSYRTDKARSERIKMILDKNPSYLENYKCKICKEAKGEPVKVQKVQPQEASLPPISEARIREMIRSMVNKPVQQPNSMQSYIPKTSEAYINRKIHGMIDEEVIDLHYNTENKLLKNVLLIGESGTGKTALIRHYCAKNKIPYYRVVLNGATTPEELLGQLLMDKNGKFTFNYGVLIEFMRHGGIFVFDEINAGQKEILHVLNSITDWERKAIITGNKGEVIEASPKFLAIACANPPEEYDLEEMSMSLKSRFVTYYLDYDENVEKTLLGKKNKVLLQLTHKVREARKNQEIRTPLTTRDLVQYVCIRDEVEKLKGITVARTFARDMFIDKFHNGEKQVVATLYDTIMEKGDILGDD